MYEKKKLGVCVLENGVKKIGGKIFKKESKVSKLPIFRGFLYFFYGLILYFKSFFIARDIEERKNKEETKTYKITKNINITSDYIVLIASIVASVVFGLVVISFLPRFIYSKLFSGGQYYFKNFMIALFRVLILFSIFVVLKFCPFMNGLYSFNSAGCVFQVGKDKKSSFIARLYPLNFLNFILNVSIFSTFMVSLIAPNIFWLAKVFVNATVFLISIPAVYEFLRFVTNSKISWLKDITLVTNFLVCNKPKTTHYEVFSVINNEMTNFESFEKIDSDKVAMSSVFAEMETKLKSADCYEQSDVDWIICNVLGKSRTEIKLVRFISQKDYREIMRACERRAKREPISSIFGYVEFYGLKFDVNKKVLSPRMETEILVEEVLKKVDENGFSSILDLCTGSGAIAVTLAKFTDAKVSASDISKQALAVAEENAKKNGVKVEFVQSDLFDGLKKTKKYDIIVSNPPYISSSEIEKLDVEVKKYDPKIALDGGEDGLMFYRNIVLEAPKRINKNGYLFFELGNGQYKDVEKMMKKAGFVDITIVKDYNKIERIIYGRRS